MWDLAAKRYKEKRAELGDEWEGIHPAMEMFEELLDLTIYSILYEQHGPLLPLGCRPADYINQLESLAAHILHLVSEHGDDMMKWEHPLPDELPEP